MMKRIASLVPALLLLVVIGLSGNAVPPAAATEIADYTAFPPFLPRVVSPNILFLLDFSTSMVRPAYGDCSIGYQNCRYKFFNPNDDYVATESYEGYFNSDKRYSCASGTGNAQCVIETNAATDAFEGNWLNWLAATQFDVMKKVVVGGQFSPAPETGIANQLYSQLTNAKIPAGAPPKEKDHTAPVQSVPTYKEFYKVVKQQVCENGAPNGLCDTTAPQRIPYSWLDPFAAAVTTRELLWSDIFTDDSGKQKTLPFSFSYFDQSYDKVNISSNGYIEFTNTVNATEFWTSPSNDDVPNAAVPNNMVAAFWDDIVVNKNILSTPSYISVHTAGVAPHRIYVITYNNMYPYGIAIPPANNSTAVSFQILLFEDDSQIVFQYKDAVGGIAGVSNNTNGGLTATVGLEGPTGSLAKRYAYNGSTLLGDSLALHMTYGYKVFRIAPEDSAITNFRPAGQPDTATYQVNISVTTGAVPDNPPINNHCADGYFADAEKKRCYNHNTYGLLQVLRDSEKAGLLAYRLAVMKFNEDQGTGQSNGARVAKPFNDTGTWVNTIVDLRKQAPTVEAPLAEALHVAQGYFRQNTAYNLSLGATDSWTNSGEAALCKSGNNDPFCFASAGQHVPCVKSFVLLLSSGNYSHDFGNNIYDLTTVADKVSLASAMRETDGEIDATKKKSKNFGGLLDNIAYQMHAPDPDADLRLNPDNLPGSQTVSLYAINTFSADSGDGTAVLKRAALYGGFKDANSNNIYDSGEDDPAAPRTYLEAGAGGGIKAKIDQAVNEILQNSASGTSVSVLSTSAGGEGALYQAYFYPAKIVDDDKERKWPGYLRAFLLDTYQQLRDDYSGGAANPDHTLNTSNDRVATMGLNSTSSSVEVTLYADTPGKLPSPAPTSPVPLKVSMDNVVSMWEGGTKLATSEKVNRHIYLWHDADNDGVIANSDFSALGGEAMELVVGNAATLAPYLRAQESTTVTETETGPVTNTVTKTEEAEKIINFIRGNEIEGYRSRCLAVPGSPATEDGCLASGDRVWPLGDIIYSTPTLVGAPAEKFNLIYGERSYFDFYSTYKSRRQVVYVGANDGMLHAFNAGVFNSNTINFKDGPDSGNGWPLQKLGDELWAFIPHESLPHLAWLACNGTATDPAACGDAEYTHVYYVDHRPRVTDARIFIASGSDPDFDGKVDGQAGVAHPNGWGSVLILPMRLGGGAIEVDLDGNGDTLGAGEKSFKSAYYAFDVTDPEKPPKLLWRFTDDDLGFTTSYPAIVRVDDKAGKVKWFMVAGSGPKNKSGAITERDYSFQSTTQNGRIFVVDLASGAKIDERVFDNSSPNNPSAPNAIMGDPIAVDVNIDFTTDVLYIGSALSATAGRVFRINTANNLSGGKYVGETDPTKWSYSTFFDPQNPAGEDPDPTAGKDMGPLLVSPSVSMDRFSNLWVYFGSGRLKNNADLRNSDQQRFYGIKDACWESINSVKCIAEREVEPPVTIPNNPYTLFPNLFNSAAVQVTTVTDSPTQVVTTDPKACPVTAIDNKCSFQEMISSVQKNYKGWYVTLDNPALPNPSERVLARSSVIGGLLLFTTYQPLNDMCSIFGNSSLYAVYYETGTASNSPVVKGALGVKTIAGKEYVQERISLGAGMPTSVGIAIGETVSGFVQKSTGEIIRIEATPALGVRSAITGWRETTGNTGNAGVETIYEHIIR